MEIRSFILTRVRQFLNEGYKLTFDDKSEIDKLVRVKYEKYKSEVDKKNDDIRIAKNIMGRVMGTSDEVAFKDSLFDYNSKLDLTKPMLFNKFYDENFDSIKKDYIAYRSRNSSNDFSYKSKSDNKLSGIDYEVYYNGLSDLDKESITKFLKLVGVRVGSGDGESIDRKRIRDSFFKTPKSFQDMFSEKPSAYLWRGDYAHPCGDEYDHGDSGYLSMQSFSTNKNVAKEFGFHFSANNIKSYSGSFSLPLYIKYGGDIYNFGDDEGEVMFFDVVYKCGG